MEPPNQKSGAGRSLEIAAIIGGGPEAAGEIIGLSFGLADGAALDVSIPVFLIPKLQMFLQHLTSAAAAKRAQLPADFKVTEVVQPFTLASSVTIKPTDQGPFLVVSQSQEGLPISIAIPREGVEVLARGLLSALEATLTKPPRH